MEYSIWTIANSDSGTESVLLGAGNGVFNQAVNYFLGLNPGMIPGGVDALALGDFDGDGKLDLAVGNGNTVEVLTGNVDGTFLLTGPEFEVPYGTFSLAVGDFNGDGKPDLAVANANAATITV